jgi:hypothetical protein
MEKQAMDRFLKRFGQWLSYSLFLALILVIIVLAMEFIPTRNQNASISSATKTQNPYPVVEIGQTPIATLSTEKLCDQWYSERNAPGLQPTLRAVMEEDYQLCITRSKNPSGLPEPQEPPNVDNTLRYTPVLHRPASGGIIIEAVTFWWHPGTIAINAWTADKEEKSIRIYAGAQTSDIKGGSRRLEDPLPGAIFIEKFPTDENPQWVYFTPEEVGPVWIVTVDGSLVTLASSNGASFVFDIDKLEYVSPDIKRPSVSIETASGTIFHNGTVMYEEFSQYNDEFNLKNHWVTKQDNEQIMVFAGSDTSQNPNAVVLVITIQDDASEQSSREAKVYKVPQTHGAVRIVDADGDKVTMVSFDGKPIIFDILARTFTFPKALSNQSLGSVFDVLPAAKELGTTPEFTLMPTPSSTDPYP